MTLSVIIPTLNAARHLEATLAALRPAPEVVVTDGGSTDGTADIVRMADRTLIAGPRGRGRQLALGAEHAGGEWLLFLHADTILSPGWDAAAEAIIGSGNSGIAAYFRFALDSPAPQARRLERMVTWRSAALGLPYGDQGLFISRTLYRAVGGYRPLALMEDADLVRRIGSGRLHPIPVNAVTSAARWEREGWNRRSARNLLCLALYFAGLPTGAIQRIYG